MRGFVVLGVVLVVCLQGGCRAEQPWPLWESYARSAFDPQGRIIDHSAGDKTTSEGQAYGMFFALVANDKARFGKLLAWTQDNMAGGDLTARLPGWIWGKAPDGNWKALDQNPASDADLWMAYSLLEAGRLWHDPRYEKLGTLMATRIAQQEIALTSVGTTLLPGPQGFHPEPSTWILNPSYLPPSVLSYMATTFPRGSWGAVLASTPVVLSQGAGGGFAMDWVAASSNGVSPMASPMPQSAGQQPGQAVGSYDAIRVYLWLGLADPETPGVRESLAGLGGMAAYMKQHTTPPRRVDGNGTVLEGDGPVGFSAAVAPYLHANNMRAQEKVQTDRMVAMKDPATGLYGRGALYYDQNLALFAEGWMEQRFRFDRQGRLKVKWR